MRIIGLTARRTPLTRQQVDALLTIFHGERGGELHHGDCQGGDETAHGMAGTAGLRRVVHPPLDDKARAFCAGEEERPPAPYLTRNRTIVDETDMLLCLPAGPERSYPRSGEWATVRYARTQEKPIVVIWPDGRMVVDR